jgi:hypothetical protein
MPEKFSKKEKLVAVLCRCGGGEAELLPPYRTDLWPSSKSQEIFVYCYGFRITVYTILYVRTRYTVGFNIIITLILLIGGSYPRGIHVN